MEAAARFALTLAALLGTGPGELARGGEPAAVVAPPAPYARSDAWFGEDKLRHVAMSFASASFAGVTLRACGVGDAASPAAVAAALAAGLGKELYDVRTGSFFSFRDLAWDVAGALVGYAVVRQAR